MILSHLMLLILTGNGLEAVLSNRPSKDKLTSGSSQQDTSNLGIQKIHSRKLRFAEDSEDFADEYDDKFEDKRAFLRMSPINGGLSKKAFLRMNPLNHGLEKKAFLRMSPLNQGLEKKAFLRMSPMSQSLGKRAFLRMNPMNQGLEKRAFFRINPLSEGMKKKAFLKIPGTLYEPKRGKKAFIRMNPLSADLMREYEQHRRSGSTIPPMDKKALLRIPNFEKKEPYTNSDFYINFLRGEPNYVKEVMKRPFFRMNPISNELKRAIMELQPEIESLGPGDGKRVDKKAFFRLNPLDVGQRSEKRAFFRLNPLTQRSSLHENVGPYQQRFDDYNMGQHRYKRSTITVAKKPERSRRSLAFPSYYTYKLMHDSEPGQGHIQMEEDEDSPIVARKSMAAFPFLMRDDLPRHLLINPSRILANEYTPGLDVDEDDSNEESNDSRDKKAFLRLNPLGPSTRNK